MYGTRAMNGCLFLIGIAPDGEDGFKKNSIEIDVALIAIINVSNVEYVCICESLRNVCEIYSHYHPNVSPSAGKCRLCGDPN